MNTAHSAIRRIPATLLAVLLALVPAYAAAQAQRAQLVSGASAQADRPMALERGTTRSRIVDLNAASLNAVQMRMPGAPASAATELAVEFFPDRSFVLEIASIADAGMGFTAYRGTVAGLPFSSATMVRSGDIVNLNVHALGRVFEIRYRGGSGHEAVEIDPTVFRDHATEPIEVSADPLPTPKAEVAKDADEFIDVMIVWTPTAQTAQGGAVAMQARAVEAIATTNTAYINAGVTQRVRLVWSGMLNYTQGGMSQDLGRLAGTTDGWMDEVHAIRDAVGADLVSLLGNYNTGTDGCGIAYLQITESSGFAANGFNVTENLSCAVANLSYPHELGHNMGARHDFFVDTGVNNINGVANQTYAHGYVDLTNRMRTVMAYNDQCAGSGFNCTRLPYFSNPSVNMTSPFNAIVAPSGSDPNADNQLLLDNTRDTVQNFRQFVNQTGAGKATLLLSAASVSESVGTVEFTVKRLAGSTGAASVNFATAPVTAVPGTHYTHTSGTLNWGAGDTADKTITVNILQNVLQEPQKTFTIALSSPSGVTISPIATATVSVRDDEPDIWPVGACAIPPGTANVAGMSAWTTASDSTAQGTCSLRSGAFTASGTGLSGIEFTAPMLAGNASFKFRTSGYQNFSHFRFYVNNLVTPVMTNSTAASGWASFSVAVPAGTNTLRWTYEKGLNGFCYQFNPSATEGSSCLDHGWIDDVILPMNTSLTVIKTGAGAGASSVTSNVGGINCGGTCAAAILAGTAVTLTAAPGPGATFTGWSGGNCSGTGTCLVNLTNAASTITANFDSATVAARARDFDGSGTSDILWRDPGTQAAIWLINNAALSGSQLIMGGGSGWLAVKNPDFNGDGRADILWHNAGLALYAVWIMDATGLAPSAQAVVAAGPGWTIDQVADFNADNRADLLWKHTDGSVAVWTMNAAGTVPDGQALLMGPSAIWSVTHVGDLNNDARADLVWRHTDGTVAAWTMNGLAPTGAAVVLPGPTTWNVIGVGDFDGNGNQDLLFKDPGGQMAIYLMNGVTSVNAAIVYGGGPYAVTHIADFNGDGRADLLFADINNNLAMWLMNGLSASSTGLVYTGAGSWTVTHIGHYNADNNADLLFKDASGQVAIWTMNGLTPTSAALIFGGAGGWVAAP